MTSTRKTKDRKVVINHTTYIFRVPAETSLDATEIIKCGRILMVKVGAMPSQDVNGNILGNAGRAWNPATPIRIDNTNEIPSLIFSAIQRTRNLIDADQKHPEGKLPRLFSTKFQKQKIERDDTVPRYFIRATAYCANCTGTIPGSQTIHPNGNGLVGSVDAFVPDPGTAVSAGNGSKKWLHNECDARQLCDEIRETIHISPFANSDEYKIPITSMQHSPESLLVTILKEQDVYSAEFARGAALMYTCCKEIK
jgi:hypothetical protein